MKKKKNYFCLHKYKNKAATICDNTTGIIMCNYSILRKKNSRKIKMLGSVIFRILLISHLISTECTHLPAPFLAYPLGNTDGSNSSGLSDYNVTILVTRCIIIQNDLWYMSCLSWSSGTLDYSHLITFNCVKNLQRLKKKESF